MTRILVVLLIVSAFTQMNLPAEGPEEPLPGSLVKRFENPPAESRPWVYWWWMGRSPRKMIQ